MRTLSGPREVLGRRAIDFVWVVRRTRDLLWLAEEVQQLKIRVAEKEARGTRVRIFVTREASPGTQTKSISSAQSMSDDDAQMYEEKEKKREAATTTITALTSSRSSTRISLDDLLTPAPNFEITYLDGAHPDLASVVADFADRASLAAYFGVKVFGTGPQGMGRIVRREESYPASMTGSCCVGMPVYGVRLSAYRRCTTSGALPTTCAVPIVMFGLSRRAKV